MKNQNLDLFVVNDNAMVVNSLKHFLEQKFGTALSIFTFNTGKSALEKIDTNTRLVILGYSLKDENINEVPESIKKINPYTKVMMLSSNEDVSNAIESFQKMLVSI